MKRLVMGSVVAIGIVVALSPFAFAQGGPAVTGVAGEDRANQIQLFGDMDLQVRYANTGFVIGASGATETESAWVGSPRLTLGIKAALADKVSTLVELYVPRVNDGTPVNYFGDNVSPHAASGGVNIGVKQAFVKLDELILQDLSVKFGLQEVVFDLVGANNPLVMALGRAESATSEGMSAAAWNINEFDERRAGGLRLDYKLGAAGSVTLFHMMVVAGGVIDAEQVTGLEAMYKVTEKSAVEGLIALINGAPAQGGTLAELTAKDSEIWLIGGGIASNGEFVENLNIFGQVYFNAGTYGHNVADEKVRASGVMFDVGGSYQFASVAWKPKVGVEYVDVSGSKTKDAKKYEGFVSYEDNNDLIVIEDKDFGFDVDQNYSVIKIRASVTGDVAGPVKDNFTLEALLGIASMKEDIAYATGKTDDLGTEIDVKATWSASKQLKVYSGFGILTGSDVLKKVLDPDAKRSTAFTFFLGTCVTF
jgi:hypothetical protein